MTITTPLFRYEIAPHLCSLVGHVSAVSCYKGALDAALVLKARRKATEEQENWLQREGYLRNCPTGTGVNSDTFARWVFGPFMKWPDNHEMDILMSFPARMAIGWNRRQYCPVTKQEAMAIKSSLDKETMNPDSGDGYARWLKPLPVFVATEGKHRVDLFRNHELEMVAKVWATPIPPATDLEIWRVWGADDIFALRCKNPRYRDSSQDSKDEFALLPLPHLSVPIFLAYGARQVGRRCMPWQVAVDKHWDLLTRLQPSRWRQLMLSAGYV